MVPYSRSVSAHCAMPDGDLIYRNVPRCYRGALRRFLMPEADDYECGRKLTEGMRDALKASGPKGFQAVCAVASVISQVADSPSEIDLTDVTRQVRAASRSASTVSDQVAIQKAGQSLAQDIRDGCAPVPADMKAEVGRRFALQKVQSEFVARLPQIERKEGRAEDGIVRSRIASAQPELEREAARFGQQASRRGGFEKLRRSNRRQSSSVDLNEAL